MRIVTLDNSGRMYTPLAYLVLGDASQLEDVNTLVDVGADPAIFASFDRAPTGVGKWAVEQVVLTHSHSDHCALLSEVRAAFHPECWLFRRASPASMPRCAMGTPSAWATGSSR